MHGNDERKSGIDRRTFEEDEFFRKDPVFIDHFPGDFDCFSMGVGHG